jgi:hypothetical protein
VTWTGTGYSISLNAPENSCENCFVTVTATTNIDVGPTPYFITLFNLDGTWLKTCAFGSTCSLQYQPTGIDEVVAFISSSSTTLLPPTSRPTPTSSASRSSFLQDDCWAFPVSQDSYRHASDSQALASRRTQRHEVSSAHLLFPKSAAL